MELLPRSNPYGETKAMCEQILTDATKAHADFAVTLLRYFNPVGAHPSGELGERPNGVPNNLMPYLLQVASGEREYLTIFGDDYPTPDGTGVRDYIHVVDLALGHVAALERAVAGGQVDVFNLGTGRGTSVRELVDTFEAVNGIGIPCQVGPRRPGDLAAYYADASKAESELGWKAQRGIADMCRDGYRFIKNQK
jgi:UDP-glucose 4-epimerase